MWWSIFEVSVSRWTDVLSTYLDTFIVGTLRYALFSSLILLKEKAEPNLFCIIDLQIDDIIYFAHPTRYCGLCVEYTMYSRL